MFCCGFTKAQALRIIKIVNVEMDHYDMLVTCEKEIGKKTYLIQIHCYDLANYEIIRHEIFGFIEGLRVGFGYRSKWEIE